MRLWLIPFLLCFFPSIFAQNDTLPQSWNWYRQVTVRGSSSDLENFVVEIVTDTRTPVDEGKMKPDGGDIRFTDDLFVIKNFPYQIVGGFNTTRTRFWVQLPFIVNETNTVLFMLMGNFSATAPIFTPFSTLNVIGSTTWTGLQYTTINIQEGGTLLLPPSPTPHVITALRINVFGSINGIGRGHAGVRGGSEGPGRAPPTANSGGGGGSYGGVGGRGGYDDGDIRGEPGPIYGTPQDPNPRAGSSGGGSENQAGGNGGAGLHLIAWEYNMGPTSVIDVSGSDGLADLSASSGGGSGGGVSIHGRRLFFHPASSLRANGGNGGSNAEPSQGDGGGGGGGGRVTVFFSESVSNSPTVQLQGGDGGCCGDVDYGTAGAAGTYFSGFQESFDFPHATVDNTIRCKPTVRCSDVAAQCGPLNDGCGTILNCGTCEVGEGCTTSLTCVSLTTNDTNIEFLPTATEPSQGVEEPDEESEFPVLAVALGAAGGFLCIVIVAVVVVILIVKLKGREGGGEPKSKKEKNVDIELQPPPTHHSQYLNPNKRETSTPYHGLNFNGGNSPNGSGGSVRSVNEALAQERSLVRKHNNWEIRYEEIEIDRELGRGAYGVVYLANWRMQWVAVKKLKEESLGAKQMQEFQTEAELYMGLRPHKNVVVFLGICTRPLCIVTEYLPMGSVESFIRSDAKIDMMNVLTMAADIAAGMSHLHAEGIIHRDLATRNLLLDNQLNIKITDFGMSRVMDGVESSAATTQSEVGPLKWMAPESIVSKEYSTKSDVFMFGVTLIEILTRDEPYPGESPMQVAMGVVRDGKRHPIPDYCSSGLAQLLQSCWETDPQTRPEFPVIYKKLWEIQSAM